MVQRGEKTEEVEFGGSVFICQFCRKDTEHGSAVFLSRFFATPSSQIR